MTALIDLRFGDKTFYKTWGGGSIMVRNFYETRRLSLDMNVDIWKQPELELIKDNALATVGGSGAGLSFRGNYDITTNKNPIVGILELGYKTPGFVEGYDLGTTPIFMFGIGIRH